MKTKKYYFNYAKKLIAMTLHECAAHLDAIAKSNGEEEREMIVSQFSNVMGGAR